MNDLRILQCIKLWIFALLLCVSCGCYDIYADAEEEAAKAPGEYDLYAQAAVLIDGDNGRILYGKKEDTVMPMASTTKIMTCILALEYGNLSDTVEVSAYAASMPDVQLNINKGEQYQLQDLLYSLMLESHNDTAVAIAEYVAAKVYSMTDVISERSTDQSKEAVLQFADLMNQKAVEIGCSDTNFVTPNGLDAERVIQLQDGSTQTVEHSTTAYNLALIMRYCVCQSEQKDTFMEITQTQSYAFADSSGKRSFSCTNHNALLSMMDGVLSGKTGFTNKAGYCYVGAVQQDGKCMIAVVLASGWPPNKTNKWADIKKMIAYGMQAYEYCDIQVDVGTDFMIQVRGGKQKLVKGQAQIENIRVLMRKDEEVKITKYLSGALSAPVTAGTEVGEIKCYLGDTLLQMWKIQTTDTVVEKKGWF